MIVHVMLVTTEPTTVSPSPRRKSYGPVRQRAARSSGAGAPRRGGCEGWGAGTPSGGYGADFDGLAPLLGMLNSCAPGVSVVNIDNGFGAGHQAALFNCVAGATGSDTSGGGDGAGR